MIRSFSFLSAKNQGFVRCKFANEHLIQSVTIWLLKNRRAEQQNMKRLFEVLNFQKSQFPKSQFLKKPVLKNCFGLMHATLKAIGSRWVIFIFGKKLRNSFQGKQETLSHFSRKPASFTPKESIQASCRSF